MSLEINGKVPTQILYKGRDITDVTIDSVGVWGKPYSLYYETDGTYSVTVRRIGSLKQNAELTTLSNGSVIYYMDVLEITIEIVGNNYLTSTTINGETTTHDANTTRAVFNNVVKESVSISSVTTPLASWHTVFTGSSVATFALVSTLKTVSFAPTLPSIPNNSKKIRASYEVGGNAGSGTGTTEISLSSGNGKSSNLSKNTSKVPELYIKCESYSVKAQGRGSSATGAFALKVTKIEAYY